MFPTQQLPNAQLHNAGLAPVSVWGGYRVDGLPQQTWAWGPPFAYVNETISRPWVPNPTDSLLLPGWSGTLGTQNLRVGGITITVLSFAGGRVYFEVSFLFVTWHSNPYPIPPSYTFVNAPASKLEQVTLPGTSYGTINQSLANIPAGSTVAVTLSVAYTGDPIDVTVGGNALKLSRYAAPILTTPTITVVDLTAQSKRITITADPGAEIWYTNDGSNPIPGGTDIRYSVPFIVENTTGAGQQITIRAVAFKLGSSNSAEASQTFTLQGKTLAAPTFSPQSQAFAVGTYQISLGVDPAATETYYTIVGVTPETRYSGPFQLTLTTAPITITAYSKNTTATPAIVSNTVSATYSLISAVARPTVGWTCIPATSEFPAGHFTNGTVINVTITPPGVENPYYRYGTNGVFSAWAAGGAFAVVMGTADIIVEARDESGGNYSEVVTAILYYRAASLESPVISPSGGTFGSTSPVTVQVIPDPTASNTYYRWNGFAPWIPYPAGGIPMLAGTAYLEAYSDRLVPVATSATTRADFTRINQAILKNLTGTEGTVIPANATINVMPEIRAGRMGTYGMGRVWYATTDPRRFRATDRVGEISGSPQWAFRDAVLKECQNRLLTGGDFMVPGDAGEIRAMRFTAVLDTNLGQGPLEILTPTTIFSCAAPPDRSTWQHLTYPILTESLKDQGGLAQESTINSNSDLIFRSLNGIRSLILAKRDFSTWGNTPISDEIGKYIEADDARLLEFSSAVTFDNRLLMTVNPAEGEVGVYSSKLAVINFDALSSLRGKSPAIYDGLWMDLNILQILKGQFPQGERCFAICYNPSGARDKKIELWEILRSNQATADNATTPIVWSFVLPPLDFNERDPKTRQYKRLSDGELVVKDISGAVTLEVWYRSDFDTSWYPWRTITIPAGAAYRPRIGLGEPPFGADAAVNKPWREGWLFHVKIQITGHCVFCGARFSAVTQPQPAFAPIPH